MKYILTFFSLLATIALNAPNFPILVQIAAIDAVIPLYVLIAAIILIKFFVFAKLQPKESRIIIAFTVILMSAVSAILGFWFEIPVDLIVF